MFGLRQPRAAAAFFLLVFLALVTYYEGPIMTLIVTIVFLLIAALTGLSRKIPPEGY